MIIKSFETNKLNIEKNKFFLFYGENEGFKNEIIKKKNLKLILKIRFTDTMKKIY